MTDNILHVSPMPAYLDKEISSADQDKFGHSHLAQALRGLIEEPKHSPPYSIGLLGKWGTGKSTVKGLYVNHLHDDETKNGDGIKRRDRIHTITFNAWKYGGEADIRKSLFRHIFLQIDGTHEEADRHLFKTISSTEFQRRPFKEIWAEFIDQYVLGLLIVGAFTGLFVVLLALMAWWFGFDDPITASVSLAASSGVVGVLALKYFSNLPIFSARTPVHITSSPSQTIDEFEALFLAQLEKFKRGKGKKVRRIVVFIDDLDRLTADEMVSGLDGIRSLIEMASHQMPDNIGIVFVISCDEERVADALSKRRATAELPAAVSNIQDARRYLDRIFQFRLEIPPFPKRDMRSFTLGLLETEYPALRDDLRRREVDLQELVDRMIHPAVQSPRNAIQIVNLFAQCWWLGALRERNAVGVDNPGGLGEGVVTRNPLTLAIICVIRTDFPDFYQALQKNPRLFSYFVDRFVRLEPLEPLPAEIHEQLVEFASEKSISDEKEKNKRWEVKPQHRGLRQFMSHVQDVRHPYSLQPLLALSQDPVSRKHGDKAVPIEEALRTSDVVALLDAAGLSGSIGSFPPDFGALLADLIDGLRVETPTIQDNVAFTVAQIDQRIPDKDKRRILGLVVRRAADSDDLRWRLGPAKLHALIPYGEREELRALGRALIDDITDTVENVRLSSLEEPSLREGRDLVQGAADLAAHLMQQVDLPWQSKSAFGQWLLSRTVKVGRQSDQLPQAWLEDKLTDHEDVLLPLIRDDYPRIIIEEFSKDEPEPIDLSIVTQRLDTVFSHFAQQGTQTREMLWTYLRGLASLQQPPLVALAFSKFADWHRDADDTAAHSIFNAMGARLIHFEEDPETWPLDDEQALCAVYTDFAKTRTSFDTDSVTNMVRLAKEWSKSSERASEASRLYAVLSKAAPEEWTALGQDWAKRFFTDLPIECQQEILATVNSQDAPNEMSAALASAINSLNGAKALEDHKVEALSRLVSRLDQSRLETGTIAEQLGQFVDDMVSLVAQNPGEHLFSKTKALSSHLDKLPTSKSTELLNSLVQLQSQPQILSGVFNILTASWPVPAAEGGLDYAAQKLFNAGIEAYRNLGQAEEASDLLVSLDSLHRCARLDQVKNEDQLVACAYELWSDSSAVSEKLCRRYPEAERTPENLKVLADAACAVEEHDEKDEDRLNTALVHEIGCTSAETVQAATNNILAQPAQEANGTPDPVLTVWTRAVAENDPQPLIDSIISDDINDDQAVRLYHRVLENIERFSDEKFISLLRKTLSMGESRDKTSDAVVRSLGDVAAQLFTSEDQRRALCEGVLSVFASLPKQARKAELAKVCKPLGLKNAIVDTSYNESMSDDDMNIIEKFTGKIR